MSPEPAIRLRGVGKVYRIYSNPIDRLKEIIAPGERPKHEFWALNNVSFEVGHGETVGVIGSNGAGKSTLMQIVAGAFKPTTGSVEIEGRVAPMIELGASFNPDFNGRENAALAADVLGVSGGALRDKMDAIIEFAGLGEFIDRPLKIYSSGMYARLAFAVFANLDADVMIVDEILSVGDAAFNQKCMRRIREFKQHGAILITSHDTQALVNLCDRVVWLERGMVRDIGSPADMCRDYLAAMNAAANTASDFKIGGQRKKPPPPRAHVDASHAVPEPGDVWAFDASTPRAQSPHARITVLTLTAADGSRTQNWQGGDEAVLKLCFEVEHSSARLAVVFDVRDRLGQILLSERAMITPSAPGAHTVRFAFVLPELQPGQYVVSATLLSQLTENEVSIEDQAIDSLILTVFRTQAFGLVGVPTPIVSLDRLGT